MLASRKKCFNSAVYLGGYAIECVLKAAICRLRNFHVLPEDYKTHDLDDLLVATGLRLPETFIRKFNQIRVWSIDLRYQTRPMNAAVARQFLVQVKEVKQWIETEMSPK